MYLAGSPPVISNTAGFYTNSLSKPDRLREGERVCMRRGEEGTGGTKKEGRRVWRRVGRWAPINEKKAHLLTGETGDNKSAACSWSPVFPPWRRPFPVSLRRDNLIYLYDEWRLTCVPRVRGYTRAAGVGERCRCFRSNPHSADGRVISTR